MFVRPEQVAQLVAKHPEIARARVVASREGERDVMTVKLEAEGGDAGAFEASVADVLKLRGVVEIVPVGGLPRDGLVIEDARRYD
jgi:phenylacetate-CoA ligase